MSLLRYSFVLLLATSSFPLGVAPASAETHDGTVRYQLQDSPPVHLASLLQEPMTDEDMEPMSPMSPMNEGPVPSILDSQSTRLARIARRRVRRPLTRAPHMFGDWFAVAGASHTTGALVGGNVHTSIPLGAASRRLKVSENNSALTKDRAWLAYNHFHNANRFDRFDGATRIVAREDSVDRFTLGWERTLCDGDWSVELRMPFANRFDVNESDFQLDGGSIGNLSVFVKHMLIERDAVAVSAGLGIGVPTGSSLDVSMPVQNLSYTLRNDAVTLQPFIAASGVAREIWFYHGFLQVDVPTGGNRWQLDEAGNMSELVVQEQTLLHLDGSVGVWLTRNCQLPRVTGVAGLLEWHMTTTLNDADGVTAPSTFVTLYNDAQNPFDVANFTAALHFEMGENLNVRFGVVAPLDEFRRTFDSEVAMQVNWIH